MAIAGTVLVLLSTAFPPPPLGPLLEPASAAEPMLFGFNEYPTAASDELQSSLNAPVRRMLAGWNVIQPDPATWDWAATDALYEQVVSDGLRPLVVAVAAPCWTVEGRPCYWWDWNPPDPSHEADWAEFLRRLTARYPEAIGIEIWNEPNLSHLFAGGANAERYTELLNIAYTAVKSVDSSMPVIGGSLAGAPGGENPGGIGDHTFLERMLANGAGEHMDAIGVHAYPATVSATWDVAAARATIGRIREIRGAAGYSSMPIWVTESGEPTATSAYPEGVSDEQQAIDLVDLMIYFGAQPDIPVAIIHRLVDYSGAQVSAESGFGVFREDGSPKLAACALRLLLGGSLECPPTLLARLATAVDDAVTIGAGSAPVRIDVMANDTVVVPPRSVATVSQPSSGGAALVDGVVTYRPNRGYCNTAAGGAPDRFTYTLDNGATASVSVVVTCAPRKAKSPRR